MRCGVVVCNLGLGNSGEVDGRQDAGPEPVAAPETWSSLNLLDYYQIPRHPAVKIQALAGSSGSTIPTFSPRFTRTSRERGK